MDESAANPKLAPRIEQTLQLLTQAYQEKEIAARLGVSPHTVHVYVKSIYRRYGVCSRAELLVAMLAPRPISREQSGADISTANDRAVGC